MNKAVFLDRDGTINVEKNYLYKIDDFEFIEGVPEAIKMLNDAGYLVIVVTNQAGIARGYYKEEEMRKLHKHINNELKKYGAHIDAYYFCPHHPEHGIGDYKLDCNCRKPKSGMLEWASKEFNIDNGKCYIIGDKISDVQSGDGLNISGILVKSGYEFNEKLIPAKYVIKDNLLESVKYIIRNLKENIFKEKVIKNE